MVNKKEFFVIFLFVFSIISCESKKTEEKPVEINYEATPSLCFFEAFDFESAELVFFEGGDEVVLSSNLEIRKGENNFVVFDKAQNQIFLFGKEGNLIRMIGRSGRGPGEYINPSFIDVDFEEREIYVLNKNGFSIARFSFEGNYFDSIEIPVYASSFATTGSNTFVCYSGYYGDPNGYRVHFIKDTTLIHSILPLNTSALDVIEPNFFPATGNRGLFRETFFPEVYEYEKDGLTELLRFDFGRLSVTESDLVKAGDPFNFFNEINNRGFATTRSAYKGRNHIVVQTMQQSNGENVESYFIINPDDILAVKVSSNKPNAGLDEDDFRSLNLFAVDENDVAYFIAEPHIINKGFFRSQSRVFQSAHVPDQENPFIIKVPISHRDE